MTVVTELTQKAEARTNKAEVSCFHCGDRCGRASLESEGKHFCCRGCLTVHDLLIAGGLGHFYDLSRHPGVRTQGAERENRWDFLDAPEVRRKLVDFTNEKVTRVTFHIPAIHCIACVWLLENLFQLHPAIGRSTVNFARREVAISFDTGALRLGELVGLLAGLGYEPSLTLGDTDEKVPVKQRLARSWLQLGLAGFAFGNIMLFSLPHYLGMDAFSGPLYQKLFSWLGLALALPVLTYSAADYWKSAWMAARRRSLTLDVPIALGLLAIYGQSALEIISGSGTGYCDSLTGLIFFLLCGRAFQRATYDRLAFDRDYKSFFPLSVTRKAGLKEEVIAISEVRVGDHLVLRNRELIPADARLLSARATLDYSFVTGESQPVERTEGAYCYAGGQQLGSTIEVETVKPVSQSYLTSLWNNEAFKKEREDHLNTVTNRYSSRFTRLVLAIAVGAALFWALSGSPTRGIKAFTSVLIVACPCALALAAPFALGTAQRILARRKVFLKNALILERMAESDSIVFDKTGTLTARMPEAVFIAAGEDLDATEEMLAHSLARNSTHPHAEQITETLQERHLAQELDSFAEIPGCGIEGRLNGREVRIGSRRWFAQECIRIPELKLPPGSATYLSIDGQCRGAFGFTASVRPHIQQVLQKLHGKFSISLLSGDNEKNSKLFAELFGASDNLHFSKSPMDKLRYVKSLQALGRTVTMVGDGLNDAGALKQSDVGIAVVEKVGAFTPASDVIIEAGQVARLADTFDFARRTVRIVRLSFLISALYNTVGISIAAAGLLSPLVCAILMPLSSASVVLFACAMTSHAGRRLNVLERNASSKIRLRTAQRERSPRKAFHSDLEVRLWRFS